jgi:transcription initiation factor TFIIB
LPVRAKAVALLYLASEFRGVNWSRGELKNVCARVGVSFGVVMETIWRIKKKLGVRTTKPDVSRVVYELADRLKLPESVKFRAAELARGLVESRLTPGKSIYGIAAAAVYVAAREVGIRLREVDVAEVAGVSEVTVGARLRDLKKALHLTGSY